MAVPGQVTGNVVGSMGYQSPQDQAAQYNLQKQMDEDRKMQWAQAAAANNARTQPSAEQRRADAEAKMKSAFEKFYSPMAQSQWDQQQGGIIGVDPNRISGTPQAGYGVFKKNAQTTMPGGMGIAAGQQPYEWRKDTNLPNYQQSLNTAYEMWKAGQLMGAEDWKVSGYPGRIYGGASATDNEQGGHSSM